MCYNEYVYDTQQTIFRETVGEFAMKYVNDLSNRQKARVITLFIISILLFFNATGYVSGIEDAGHQIDYVEDMDVDGSDFSPIANLFILGTNGILQLLTGLLAAAAMIILSLILLVPWRLAAIRKNSEISKKELSIAKAILILFVTITLITSCILTRFTYVSFIVLLVLIPTVFLLTLGVLPLKNAYKRANENQTGE